MDWTDDVITVVNHVPFYMSECDMFDRIAIGFRRVSQNQWEFYNITSMCLPLIILDWNPLNIFPVHDLPYYGGTYA